MVYLGHIISKAGVAVDRTKIQAMMDWPISQNLKELRGFLGLTGYYRKFIARYAAITAPLTDQLKKDNFCWSSEATEAFRTLQHAMTKAPILAMPNFTLPFVVETDACGFGVGAVLLQAGHPIAYFSKILGPRAWTKSIYEKELMAIVFAVQKWRHYLLGRKFLVKSDQQSLRFLMQQREIGPEYQRWVNKLLGYDFDIIYKPRASNKVVDALSREFAGQVECSTMVSSGGVPWDEIRKQIQHDPFISQLRETLEKGKEVPKGYTLENGVVKYKGRLVIPNTSILVQSLLHEYHDTPMGGHSRDLKTYQRLASEWYWLGMRKAVTKYVQSCLVCQQQKSSALSPAGLLQPLPIPAQIWEDIAMDFIEGLPKSSGWDTVLVVVDRLSKYGHFVGLKHPFSAQTIANTFMREIVKLHGFPATIVSDRDKVFMSIFWKKLFRIQGSALNKSTAYQPQSDGQSEVVNKGLETYLRCFINGQPRS